MLAAGRKIVGSGGRQSRRLRAHQCFKQIHSQVACLTTLSSQSHATSRSLIPIPIQSSASSLRFSSSSLHEQPTSTTTDETTWKTTTQGILEEEVGSMTPHQWHEAEESLSYWVGLLTCEGVDEAWKLLDRVVEEERYGNTVDSAVTIEWLIRVLHAWRGILPADNSSSLLQPNDVLEKIDEFAPILLPDPRIYHMIVDAAIKVDPSGAPDFCQSVLDRMHEEAEVNPQVRPDGFMHSILLHALANSGRPDAAQQAEAALQQMKGIGGEMAPTNPSYTAVLSAWAKSGEKDAPRRAEALLHEMAESSSVEVYPNTIAFSAVINAWAKSKEPGAAKRAESILNHMEILYKDGNEKVKPNKVCYSTVMDAYAKAGQPQEAEEILQRLQDAYETTGDAELRPDVVPFTIVLNGWAKSAKPGAAKRAEKILNQMENMSKDGNDKVKTSAVNYGVIIAAYAKAGRPREADEVLQRLQDIYEATGNADLCPNMIVFSTIINAWSKSEEPGAPKRAESVLNRMESLYKDGNEDVKPNAVCYSTVMDAYAKADQPQEAEEILQRLRDAYEKTGDAELRPDVVPFTIVLNAWANCNEPSGRKEAPKRIQAIIRHMIELWSNGDEHLKPTRIQYGVLIKAYTRVGNVVAAEKILNRMESEASQGNEDVRPNTKTYNIVIDAYAKEFKNRFAAQRAESIFRRMQKMHEAGDPNVKPGAYSFTSVIFALAWSRDPAASDRAMRYLDYMKELRAAGHDDCKPNTVTYTAVISAFESNKEPDAVDKAYDLLREMREKVKSGDRDVKPDANTYRAMLKVVASSHLPDKAERAQQIFQEMMDDALVPSLREYREVLRACAYLRGDDQHALSAFRIAVETFEAVHDSKHLRPNPHIYALFFQACGHVMDSEERANAVKEGYQRCCENGFGSYPQVEKTMKKFDLLSDSKTEDAANSSSDWLWTTSFSRWWKGTSS